MQTIAFVYDSTRLGHANAAVRYARALRPLTANVLERALTPEEWLNLSDKDLPEAELIFQCFIPPQLRPLAGRVNVAVVFHEWDLMPKAWAELMNRFDAVIASSGYLAGVFARSGCAVPIHTVPIPVEPDKIPSRDNWECAGPFRFLSVGEWHFRKGFHLLINAFLNAFPEPGAAELVIKTSADADYRPPAPHVAVATGAVPEEDLLALYSRFDAYVTTTLAEGFGLPVVEAMAAGLPVVAPTWSGLADFCGEGRSFELPFLLAPQPYCSKPDYFAPGQRCAIVDLESCSAALRRIAAMEAAQREAVAVKAGEFVKKNFNLEIVGKRLLELAGTL